MRMCNIADGMICGAYVQPTHSVIGVLSLTRLGN